MDEIRPLSKYAMHAYNDPKIYLKYYPDTKNSFDADFIDADKNLIERVEVTMAIDGQGARINAESLVQFGHSRIYETPKYSGNVSSRLIEEPSSMTTGSDERIRKQKELLQKAFDKKHNNIEKYPNTTLLFGINSPLLFPWELDEIFEDFRIPNNTFQSIKCVNVTDNFYRCLK